MPIEPSVVDNILLKYCYAAPGENREACAKALKEEFEAYRAKTSQRVSMLEIQVDELEDSLIEAREAKEEMEDEMEQAEKDEEYGKMLKQFWELCERT
jgi:hypothetical protein